MRGLALALVLVSACGRPKSNPQNEARAAIVRPWYLDPDEDCDFDSSNVHSDPIRLAREFLDRDSHGQFLESNPWFNAAVICPGHEPGPDVFVVIRSYQVAFDTLPPDTVRARVSYQRLGLLGGGHLNVDTTTEVRTLKLTDGPYGWRIEGPAAGQHVLLDVTLQLKWLSDSLKTRLQAIAKSHGA